MTKFEDMAKCKNDVIMDKSIIPPGAERIGETNRGYCRYADTGEMRRLCIYLGEEVYADGKFVYKCHAFRSRFKEK